MVPGMEEIGPIVEADGRVGVLVGTWGKVDERGHLVVFPGESQATRVGAYREVPELTGTPTSVGYVLSPETATALGSRRILVHRICCGWDWVSGRSGFLLSRTRGECVAFHTPNHDRHLKDLTEPGWEVKQAGLDWQETKALL